MAITGDSLRHAIGWQTRSITNLRSASYMLRLHLHNATAYALTIYK